MRHWSTFSADNLPAKPKQPAGAAIKFVGAGPGDVSLLTLRAAQALQQADVVVHDRLIGNGILELARRQARFINVGKSPGGAGTSQAEINQILVKQAKEGNLVVRLKGGDPAIFARLDEEIAAARAAGIKYEVIPGVTAASAAAAEIGVSLTNRDSNSSLTLVTGRGKSGPAEHDWGALAKPGVRAAVYMGLAQAGLIQGRLLMSGAEPTRAVTIVANASMPQQQIIETTLGELSEAIAANNITAPSVMLIGYTAANLSVIEACGEAVAAAP